MVASKLQGGAITVPKKMNRGNWIGRLALQGHYPIYLTVGKGPSRMEPR